MYFLTLILVLTLTKCFFRLRQRKKYKLPPGPMGLPLLGNIHQLIVQNHFECLRKWAENFGKIYTINFCTKQAVVINDPKLLRDIFNTFESTGKFQTDSLLLISQGPYGVMNSEGHNWSAQRKFCLKKLKEFGFGNKRMETIILSEGNAVCNWLTKTNQKFNNKPLHLNPILVQSMVNTVWTMVAGTRTTSGDSKITQLVEAFMSSLQYTMKTGLMFLPWLKYIAPGLSGYTALDNACRDAIKYIENEFMDHKKTFTAGVQRDLIDAYIEESGEDTIKWKNAVAAVVELFVAGSEATVTTLTWLMCYLSVNPEIQATLQKEIDTVVGDQNISLDHKSRMPFTEAVILETMRMSSFAPIGLLHQLLDDLEIENYKFPKGLIVVPNLYHCHYNKDVWNDPEVFRPQRFLEQGIKLKQHVVPFQLGKRQCIGEPLAKDILFIYVTRIFQSFDVTPDPVENPMDYYKPIVGYNRMAPALGLCVTQREK